jgi:hypothetical protein
VPNYTIFALEQRREREMALVCWIVIRDAVRNDPKACGILPLPHKHSGQTYDMGYLETVIDEEMAEIDNSMPVVDIFVSDPSLRNELVADIRARGLRRPQENISRNS